MDAGVIMGQSTDALLWFGLCWTEKDEKYYENGLPSVVQEHMRTKMRKPDDEDELDEDTIESAVDKLLKPLGCELVSHCYGDGSRMIGLAVSASYECASRGYPIDLTGKPHMTGWPPEWREKLERAAEAIGWPLKPPSWWLASYWG